MYSQILWDVVHCIATAANVAPRGYDRILFLQNLVLHNQMLARLDVVCRDASAEGDPDDLEAAFAWAADLFFTERAQRPQLELLELLSCLALAAELFDQACSFRTRDYWPTPTHDDDDDDLRKTKCFSIEVARDSKICFAFVVLVQGLSALKRVEVAQLCADCSLHAVVTGRGGLAHGLQQGAALALMMREQHLRINDLVDAHRPT